MKQYLGCRSDARYSHYHCSVLTLTCCYHIQSEISKLSHSTCCSPRQLLYAALLGNCYMLLSFSGSHFQVRNSKTIYFENGDTKEEQICRDAPTANGSHPSEWPHFYGRPFMRQAVLLYWYEQVARQYDLLCCSLLCQNCHFWLSTVHEAVAARSSAHPA